MQLSGQLSGQLGGQLLVDGVRSRRKVVVVADTHGDAEQRQEVSTSETDWRVIERSIYDVPYSTAVPFEGSER